jgi:hypothetical protein
LLLAPLLLVLGAASRSAPVLLALLARPCHGSFFVFGRDAARGGRAPGIPCGRLFSETPERGGGGVGPRNVNSGRQG